MGDDQENQSLPFEERLTPQDSIYELEDYLRMLKVLSDELSFRILLALYRRESIDQNSIQDKSGSIPARVESRLFTLQSSGLIRRSRTPSRKGPETRYRISALGETFLENGIIDLIDAEQELSNIYRG